MPPKSHEEWTAEDKLEEARYLGGLLDHLGVIRIGLRQEFDSDFTEFEVAFCETTLFSPLFDLLPEEIADKLREIPARPDAGPGAGNNTASLFDALQDLSLAVDDGDWANEDGTNVVVSYEISKLDGNLSDIVYTDSNGRGPKPVVADDEAPGPSV